MIFRNSQVNPTVTNLHIFIYAFRNHIYYEIFLGWFSANFSAEAMGIISMPQKKLLTPWTKSQGSPATIHPKVAFRLKPYIMACTGAYNVPNKKPCMAHSVIYTRGCTFFGIFLGNSITPPQSIVHI